MKDFRRGVSLVDALVALFLFSSLVAVFFQLTSIKTKKLDATEQRLVVLNAMVNEIEELKISPPESSSLPLKREIKIANYPHVKGTAQIRLVEEGLAQVTVEMKWKTLGGQKAKEVLSTYIEVKK